MQKQLKVQYIGIFEEINSFYWPKMHFLKEGQKIRAWVDPPSPPPYSGNALGPSLSSNTIWCFPFFNNRQNAPETKIKSSKYKKNAPCEIQSPCNLFAKSMYWSEACTLPRQGTRLAPAQFIAEQV